MWFLLQISCSFRQWKEFKNRLRFDKIRGKKKDSHFLAHSVYTVEWMGTLKTGVENAEVDINGEKFRAGKCWSWNIARKSQVWKTQEWNSGGERTDYRTPNKRCIPKVQNWEIWERQYHVGLYIIRHIYIYTFIYHEGNTCNIKNIQHDRQ